jgi:quercetin dioxygenase-like cupin family protein
MKRFKVTSSAVLAAGALLGAAAAQGQKAVVHIDSAKAEFKEANPGVSMASIWGDRDKEAHGVFVKFAPGTKVPLHTHTNDLRMVVTKGAYIYKPEKGAEIRVGPGQYLFIPGGDRHESGGDAKEGALFYNTSTGPFDLVPVK